MGNRRTFLMTLTAGLVALGVIVAPAIADELFGVIIKVDVDAKKLVLQEKDSEKEVEITTNDDTELVTPKGANKLDLEKLSGFLSKVQEKGKKGIPAKVTHEKGVASKITVAGKKKAAPKNEN